MHDQDDQRYAQLAADVANRVKEKLETVAREAALELATALPLYDSENQQDLRELRDRLHRSGFALLDGIAASTISNVIEDVLRQQQG